MTVIINHILYFFKEGFKDKRYFGLIYNLCSSEDKTEVQRIRPVKFLIFSVTLEVVRDGER